jgi:threonine dehydrogenase-like Zn-dependent dehydrogenase
MRGAVLYGPRAVRSDERPDPTIIEPTDAVIRLSATCVCGSDLWLYRGLNAASGPHGSTAEVSRTPTQFVMTVTLTINGAPQTSRSRRECQLLDALRESV